MVPADTLLRVLPDGAETDGAGPPGDGGCRHDRTVLAPARFRPRLTRGPLTQAAPFDPANPPASALDAMQVDPSRAVPDDHA